MNITILRLKESVYVSGRGALDAFYANEGAEIKVTDRGHFTVKQYNKQFMFPSTSVAWCQFEDTGKDVVTKK